MVYSNIFLKVETIEFDGFDEGMRKINSRINVNLRTQTWGFAIT